MRAVGSVDRTAVRCSTRSVNYRKATTVDKEVMAIRYSNQTGLLIKKFLESPFAGKHPKLIKKGTKAAAAEAAVTAAEAIAVVDLEEAQRLAAKSEALGGGALTMALAQEAEPGGPSRECWLAHERLRVSEARLCVGPELARCVHKCSKKVLTPFLKTSKTAVMEKRKIAFCPALLPAAFAWGCLPGCFEFFLLSRFRFLVIFECGGEVNTSRKVTEVTGSKT